ncbi:hypothetical protein [Nonomuraea insulae]|uniref:Secreted protein n=1 Tax=Nonomuraea insulae TaxID=1616787 RepID=A0ABW1CGQ4_9ACTN
MLSRSKRIFAVATLTLVTGAALAAPAHAEEEYLTGLGILRALHGQLCLPDMTTGVPIVDAVLPHLAACGEVGLTD